MRSKKIVVVVLALSVPFGMCVEPGCTPAVVAPSVDLGACVANVETTEPPSASIEKRIADAFIACNGDILAIINALSKSHANDPVMLAGLEAARAEYTAHPIAFRMKIEATVADGGVK